MKRKVLIIVLVGMCLIVGGCANSEIEKLSDVEQPSDIEHLLDIEDLEETILSEEQGKETISYKLTRNHSAAKETNIGNGEFFVGADVLAGRYVFFGSGIGNLSIYEGNTLVLDEAIDATSEMGVPTVTIDLYDQQKIVISGLNHLKITPAETLVRTSLSTGNWTVGLDIAPGKYVCEPVTDTNGLLKGSGRLLIYEEGTLIVNEQLDAEGNSGVKSTLVELKEGQGIRICGLPQVKFTERS